MIRFVLEPGDQGFVLTVTVIHLLATLRAHEAEDADAIPDVLCCPKNEPRCLANCNIHEALTNSGQLGKHLGNNVFNLNDPLTTLAGRVATYPADWRGADRQQMALSGLYYIRETGDVCCFVCGVSFRQLNQAEACPWQEHGELVPNCRQLMRYLSSGPRPTPAAKRRRHNSSSSATDMTRDPPLLPG